MSDKPIIGTAALGMPWPTIDPFIACMRHMDHYPPANEDMGPAASLAGRAMGQDFSGKDGWSMYHGHTVPGFPQHPHRGFETVTIMLQGFVDHSDSLGATARFGAGDVQWLTAGAGIVHCEMFPLREQTRSNPLELFQIWLNLPARDKHVPGHFSMLWKEQIPVVDFGGVKITVIAGSLHDVQPPVPPPHSWANHRDADLAIWLIDLPAHAGWTIPAARNAHTQRVLYPYSAGSLTIAGTLFDKPLGVQVRGEQPITLEAHDKPMQLLMLQGRPLNEPVAQQGPFVMNTEAEIRQAFADYRRTQFGGWPWPTDDPVHPRATGRFAQHADGRIERPQE